MKKESNFKFNISLSVLNHLGRNLYRSFATVLGEAISNSWDADAKNVWIDIDREKNIFCIKDDGSGMTTEDFQEKFLKIGYSKRKKGDHISPGGRHYIGRKGIGKLALLSCADKISVISKTKDGKYIGGMIDNAGLDKAITDDVSAHEYVLNDYDDLLFELHKKDHSHGTIVCFQGIKDGIHNTDNFLKKIIALYFRFSLLDPEFNIYFDGESVTLESLKEIAENTQFIWNINKTEDPYLNLCTNAKENISIEMNKDLSGFIASVKKPKDRNIYSTGERVGIDLFVNGRLRETDILKHIPSARVPESYLYGQIHFNALDGDEVDRFTSSRESIIADDPKYKDFLKELKNTVLKIISQWDVLREKHRQKGDPDNDRYTEKERAGLDLANAVFAEFIPVEESAQRKLVDEWCSGLLDDAKFNFGSYADCFVAENLLRKYIKERSISIEPKRSEIDFWRGRESIGKQNGNLTIALRLSNDDVYYLDMENLVKLTEPRRGFPPDTLLTDEAQFTPIRNAVMHTSILTSEAKRKLSTVFDNIKGKIKLLLSSNDSQDSNNL